MVASVSEHVTVGNDLYQFTVDDFTKMVEVGILTASSRVELIEGTILNMSPIGSLHASLVKLLNALLNEKLSKQVVLSIQDPIQLNENNMPQPDLALLKPRKDYYAANHPQAADIFIVIEVSDSTLEMDQKVKSVLYAAANIPEYWIVDVTGKLIEQYTQPIAKGYTQKIVLKAGDMLKTTQFAEFVLPINQIFRIDTE